MAVDAARIALLGSGAVGLAVLRRLAEWQGLALGNSLRLVFAANTGWCWPMPTGSILPSARKSCPTRRTAAPEAAAIWSGRCRDQPLVIQGPGAGAEVTAAALLDDVLHLRCLTLGRALAA